MTLAVLLMAAAAGLVPCSYRTARDPEIAPRGYCASRGANGSVRIVRRNLLKFDYRPDGIAGVFVAGAGWVYVRRSGATLRVLASDNGPDDFSEGLVRIRRGGRIGYADRSFRTVIAPRFDFGWPFENGKALVCRGCRPSARDSRTEDHSPVVGGTWGFIDHAGREIVPIRFSREEALVKPDSR